MSVAYLLWLISGFGALGFHRFYLGRIGTGLLWLFTGGLFGIGAFVDLFYIPAMIKEANIGLRYREALFNESRPPQVEVKRDSLEKVILRTAKKNRGVATPGEVALEGDISIDEAKSALEKLVIGGYADMKVKKTGVIVYVFPEFMEDNGEFEDI
jgi:hypothetical protein